MTTKKHAVGAAGVILAASGPAWSQTDPLYMSSEASAVIHIVRGGGEIGSFATDHGYEFQTALAVAGDVRTIGAQPGTIGGKYALAGGYMGGNYRNKSGQTLIDGATDGLAHNYSVGWVYGDVFRFDRSWGHPETIFSTGGPCDGITFDLNSQTLWITASFSSTIYHYDLSGKLLGSFESFASDLKSIAWEPSTDTLWINSRDDDVLWQFDKSGNLLQQVHCGVVDNILGMEFSIGVPSPGVGALAGLACMALSRRRRP